MKRPYVVFECSYQRVVVDIVQNDGHFSIIFSADKPRIKSHLLTTKKETLKKLLDNKYLISKKNNTHGRIN